MAILSTTYIHINAKELSYYVSCSLQQEIGEHHILDLHCLLETIEKFCDSNNHKIEDILGTLITVETKSYANLDFHGILKFRGIITGLIHRKGLYAGHGNYVVIKAKSTTIITDDGPHYMSYNNLGFVDIIKNNFKNYDASKLKINTTNSKLTTLIPYTVQYNESCYAFAQRLATRNGEWMYYNGEELIFGLPAESNPIELILGRGIQDFNISLIPIPQNFKYFTNDYLADNTHETVSSSADSITNGDFGILNGSSKSMFAHQTRVWVNIPDDKETKSRLDTYVKLQQTALQTNQVQVSGTSDNPGVGLGAIIKISQSEYRVTKVTHSYSNNGEYKNYFEAKSTNIDAYPKTDVNAFPVAQSQTAKVKENHDPDGLGRVKVEFRWQKSDGLLTPWIRSVSPSASNGQGFFFVPEVDDEVFVDFEGGNAECPYVIGGVYNSNAIPPPGSSNSSNHIKMLQSRSGSYFKLNDEDGSITIQDKSGSSIVLDGSGNIIINAAKSLTVNTGENIKTTSAKDTSIESGKDLLIKSATKATLKSDKDLLVEGGTGITIKDKVKVDISAKKVTAKGDIGLKLEGKNVDINGDVATNVKGAMLNLNC